MIVVSEGLANYFNVGLGDTLLFMGQGYHGATAYGAFPIVVLLNDQPGVEQAVGINAFSESSIHVQLRGSRDHSSSGRRGGFGLRAVGAALKGSGAEGLEILEWKELFPEIIQTIEVDMAGGRIFVTILYFIIYLYCWAPLL